MVARCVIQQRPAGVVVERLRFGGAGYGAARSSVIDRGRAGSTARTTPLKTLDAGVSIDYRRLSMNKIAAQRLDRAHATEWASWFRALGDPTRVMILHLLSSEDRPMTVGEITDAVDVGQSTISHHLAKLAEVRFVLVEHIATSSLWRVNTACLAAFPTAAQMVMGNVPTEFTKAMECTQ